METAYNSLATVYMGQAEEYEKAGEVQAAMDAFNRCLRAADKVGDMKVAAKANHSLGMLYFGQSSWQVHRTRLLFPRLHSLLLRCAWLLIPGSTTCGGGALGVPFIPPVGRHVLSAQVH